MTDNIYHLNSDKFWHHIPKPGMAAHIVPWSLTRNDTVQN